MPLDNGAGGGGWRPFGAPPGPGWSGSVQPGQGGPIPGMPGQAGNMPGMPGQAGNMPGMPGQAGNMPGMPSGASGGGQAGGAPGMPAIPGGASGSVQGGSKCQLKQETDFPGVPTKATMWTYVPKSFKEGNPIVVALHHCGGSASGFFQEMSGLGWAKMADDKGFLMIFAGSPEGSKGCWDVSSAASLKHDGGGDTQTIANMVKFAKKKYGAGDGVYLTGQSSGAMMTQLLSAVYPEDFVAGAAFSGVPADTCTGGTLNEPVSYWTQQAKDMYAGYSGSYPKMMLVHGTNDPILHYNDHREATKQWCGLHGFDPENPTKKEVLPSLPNYEASSYGSAVVAITAKGVTHDNPAKADLACNFFGL
ncbi:hypothetical protein [Sporisorium scitamineum]|uniref:Uncharacterized protein n=1 Tax=Sporisorium scitamineum TaxID=49012 RepID=A0A0F7RTY8_9BASI|nr:hypothetical protein [Sporisorium scitamineum]